MLAALLSDPGQLMAPQLRHKLTNDGAMSGGRTPGVLVSLLTLASPPDFYRKGVPTGALRRLAAPALPGREINGNCQLGETQSFGAIRVDINHAGTPHCVE